MTQGIRVCAQCRYIRRKPPLDPFTHLTVWTAEQIKLRADWLKERAEIALQEQHRFGAGDEFDYEPETLPWCAAWTEKEGEVVDPVTGKRTSIFAICARRNARGDCALFERA